MSNAILIEKKKLTTQKFTKYINGYLKDNHLKPNDIRTIVVTDCHLTQMPSLYYFTALHDLTLSPNKIESFVDDMTSLQSLTLLNISTASSPSSATTTS